MTFNYDNSLFTFIFFIQHTCVWNCPIVINSININKHSKLFNKKYIYKFVSTDYVIICYIKTYLCNIYIYIYIYIVQNDNIIITSNTPYNAVLLNVTIELSIKRYLFDKKPFDWIKHVIVIINRDLSMYLCYIDITLFFSIH